VRLHPRKRSDPLLVFPTRLTCQGELQARLPEDQQVAILEGRVREANLKIGQLTMQVCQTEQYRWKTQEVNEYLTQLQLTMNAHCQNLYSEMARERTELQAAQGLIGSQNKIIGDLRHACDLYEAADAKVHAEVHLPQPRQSCEVENMQGSGCVDPSSIHPPGFYDYRLESPSASRDTTLEPEMDAGQPINRGEPAIHNFSSPHTAVKKDDLPDCEGKGIVKRQAKRAATGDGVKRRRSKPGGV